MDPICGFLRSLGFAATICGFLWFAALPKRLKFNKGVNLCENLLFSAKEARSVTFGPSPQARPDFMSEQRTKWTLQNHCSG